MIETISRILGFMFNIHENPQFLESELFLERAKQYALVGVSESMFGGFNACFVKGLKHIFGDTFNMECVRVWGNFLETITHALFDHGEEEEYIGNVKMLEGTEKGSGANPKVTLSLTRRKFTVYGSSMKLLFQYELSSISKVQCPIPDKLNVFSISVDSGTPFRFMCKSESDFDGWEKELRRRIPYEKFSTTGSSESPSNSKKSSSSTTPARRSTIDIVAVKPGRSSAGSKKKADASIIDSIRLVMADEEKLHAVSGYTFTLNPNPKL